MKRFGKLVAAAVLPALLVLLASCIDIEATIQVDEGGNGTVVMNYSVSKLVMELGQLDDDDPFSPLPVSENDFTATAAMIPGLELESVSVGEDEKAVFIESEFDFTGIGALSSFFSPEREDDPSLTREGGETVFRYILYTAAEDINGESMKMIESFFAEDEVVLRLQAPSEIISANIGSFEGNTAEYSTTILDIFTENTDVLWEVRW